MDDLKQYLINKQITLANKINALADVNLVTCGNCGEVLLHDNTAETIQCPCCQYESEPCDFPDSWFNGAVFNASPIKKNTEEYIVLVEYPHKEEFFRCDSRKERDLILKALSNDESIERVSIMQGDVGQLWSK